jgi:hypothetical protein
MGSTDSADLVFLGASVETMVDGTAPAEDGADRARCRLWLAGDAPP